MARITRSKKLQTLEDQTYTRNNSTIAHSNRTPFHTEEINNPLEEDKALVLAPTTSNTALEMISGNVSTNTNIKCKLVVRSSKNDLSIHRSSMKQGNKLVKNNDIDLCTKRPKNKKNANETRYMEKDSSPRSTSVDSNKDNHDSSYLGKEKTVNVDELAKKSYKKSIDDTPLSVECLIPESSVMNEINSGSVKIDDGEDSFIAQIISRSPAKPISRIENSVEEHDQLETDLEVLNKVAQVENMIEHKPHPKLRILAIPNMRPVITRKVVSAISPKISSISPAKFQSPSKLKKKSLSKATAHNDSTHAAQNLELQRKSQPDNTAIDSNKSHIRPIQVHRKKVTIKPSKDQENTHFSKIQSNTIVQQAPTTVPPKVKKSKSYSNLKVLDSHDNVFTRLSTGTYKSRSNSRKTDEKVTQLARARKSCYISHSPYHKVTNSTTNSCDLSREKDTSVNLSRPLKTQTSQKNPHKTKSSLVSPQDLKPPLGSSSKQTSDSHFTTTLRRETKSRAVGETHRRETTPEKDIEKELNERRNAALLARAEAAEKGRRAVMEWAERKKTKM